MVVRSEETLAVAHPSHVVVSPAPPGQPLRTVEQAAAYVAGRCLTPAEPGPVGLEAEWHVLDVHEPRRQPSWNQLSAAVQGFHASAGSALTLEPGGQVELSTPIAPGARAAADILDDDEAALRAHLAGSGLTLFARGVDPGRAMNRIHPGSRYAAMETAFGAAGHGSAAAHMMTSTASVQVNLEAGAAGTVARRMWLAQALGPAFVAAFANSPWPAGSDPALSTAWPAARMRTWARLDPSRTAAPMLRPDDTDEALAERWATFALGANVLVLPDADRGHTPGPPVSFAGWLRGGAEFRGREPQWSDLDYHLTTLWPPVRLRGFLEVRWLDALPADIRRIAVTAVSTLMDRVPDDAAVIAAPTAGLWVTAVQEGLAHSLLRSTATQLLHLAAAFTEGSDGVALSHWAENVTAHGRCPGHELREAGPVEALSYRSEAA
jgi:glutamate--cysteine ligase